MKKIWLGSSWKMNKTSTEVAKFCIDVEPFLQRTSNKIQSFFIPPFPYVEALNKTLGKHDSYIGVQNIGWAEAGAFTGEVSALMAKDIGADIVEIGHSERRKLFNETDGTVNKKVNSAISQGLRPLICVGDTADEKHWQVSVESIIRQVKIALFDIDPKQLDKVIIAYEPVWAIGEHGTPATAIEAENGLRAIKHSLIETYGKEEASKIVLLYGGSVNCDNAAELIQQPSIDGLFVGRAAWDASGYAKLLAIVESSIAVEV